MIITIVGDAKVLVNHGLNEPPAVNDPCVDICLKFANIDSKSTPCYLIL